MPMTQAVCRCRWHLTNFMLFVERPFMRSGKAKRIGSQAPGTELLPSSTRFAFSDPHQALLRSVGWIDLMLLLSICVAMC